MALVSINLLQQQQKRSFRMRQANYVVLIVVGAVIGLELLVAVFLFATASVRSGEKQHLLDQKADFDQQVAKLDKQANEVYPGMTLTQQAKSYQSQIDSLKGLIDNHKYFTLYLQEIALNTPSQVVYSSFNTNSGNKLLVSGTADAYSDVAKLAETLGHLTFSKSAQIQDAKLDTTKVGHGKAVSFTIGIDMKSAAELKKLPSPLKKASPSPQPSAGPTPAAPASLGGSS